MNSFYRLVRMARHDSALPAAARRLVSSHGGKGADSEGGARTAAIALRLKTGTVVITCGDESRE